MRVVVVQHPVDRVLQVAVAGDEMGEGSVAVALLGLGRATTGSVSSFGFPARSAGIAHRPSGVAGGRQQPVGNHEGTGVDERIVRNTAFGSSRTSELNGSRTLRPTPCQTRSPISASSRAREQPAHTLDGEGSLDLADAVDLTVERGQGHAERVRYDAGQGRDVVGHLAAAGGDRRAAIARSNSRW